MKIKAKSKDCQLVVKVKTSLGETINEQELDRFARIYLRGFLKPKKVKKNQIEYSGPIGVSLCERLQKNMSKRDFLFIIEQIVVAVQKLYANNLSISNMVMDIRYAFVNEVTKEVQFLYVPVTECKNVTCLNGFVESIVYCMKPTDEKDSDFVSRFIYFYKGMQPFDINKIESFIAKEDKSVINTIKKQNAGQSGFMTDKHLHYYEHYNGQDSDEATGLLSDEEEETGLLNNGEATGLLVEEEDTGLLESANVHFPSLLRMKTGEKIILNKPVFRLGKEKSYVDYFVSDNVAVSRSHADIVTRGNRYFIIDLNSKNHTYINEQMTAIQCEVEIRDGDKLKLADEEFIFQS